MSPEFTEKVAGTFWGGALPSGRRAGEVFKRSNSSRFSKLYRAAGLLAALAFFCAGSARAASSTFTATGNWQVPSGVTKVLTIAVWAAGGGGGGQNLASDGGGGGGGGAYARTELYTVTPLTTYRVVIGTAGAGGTGACGNGGGIMGKLVALAYPFGQFITRH